MSISGSGSASSAAAAAAAAASCCCCCSCSASLLSEPLVLWLLGQLLLGDRRSALSVLVCGRFGVAVQCVDIRLHIDAAGGRRHGAGQPAELMGQEVAVRGLVVVVVQLLVVRLLVRQDVLLLLLLVLLVGQHQLAAAVAAAVPAEEAAETAVPAELVVMAVVAVVTAEMVLLVRQQHRGGLRVRRLHADHLVRQQRTLRGGGRRCGGDRRGRTAGDGIVGRADCSASGAAAVQRLDAAAAVAVGVGVAGRLLLQ